MVDYIVWMGFHILSALGIVGFTCAPVAINIQYIYMAYMHLLVVFFLFVLAVIKYCIMVSFMMPLE